MIPLSPEILVPIDLTVATAPNLVLGGYRTFESSRDHGSATSHRLLTTSPPLGGAEIELSVVGDYDAPDETATLTIEDIEIGTVGATGLPTCGEAVGTLRVSPDVLGEVGADNDINFVVSNTGPSSIGSSRTAMDPSMLRA